MVEVEAEIQTTLLAVTDTIPIDLVLDMVVIMVPQVEMIVTLQMIYMELLQLAPPPLNLKGDIDMINIHTNMINLSRI